MAEKRMFAKSIIDSDAFLSMPLSTQALYFHLCMRADDDGFVSNPRKIQRMISCTDDDLKLLIAKRYILAFDSGVIVIKHWRIHNYIRKDTYHETLYQEEKSSLYLKHDGAYTDRPLIGPSRTSDEPVDGSLTQYRLDKNRLDKNSINNTSPASQSKKHKYGEYKNVLLSDTDIEKLKSKFPDWKDRIETLSQGIEMKGYKYKNHYLAILKWAERDHKKRSSNPESDQFSNDMEKFEKSGVFDQFERDQK